MPEGIKIIGDACDAAYVSSFRSRRRISGNLLIDELATATKEPAPTALRIRDETHHVVGDRSVLERLPKGNFSRSLVGIACHWPSPGLICDPCNFDNVWTAWCEFVLVPTDNSRSWNYGVSVRMNPVVESMKVPFSFLPGEPECHGGWILSGIWGFVPQRRAAAYALDAASGAAAVGVFFTGAPFI
jgi:hypothetical protein